MQCCGWCSLISFSFFLYLKQFPLLVVQGVLYSLCLVHTTCMVCFLLVACSAMLPISSNMTIDCWFSWFSSLSTCAGDLWTFSPSVSLSSGKEASRGEAYRYDCQLVYPKGKGTGLWKSFSLPGWSQHAVHHLPILVVTFLKRRQVLTWWFKECSMPSPVSFLVVFFFFFFFCCPMLANQAWNSRVTAKNFFPCSSLVVVMLLYFICLLLPFFSSLVGLQSAADSAKLEESLTVSPASCFLSLFFFSSVFEPALILI